MNLPEEFTEIFQAEDRRDFVKDMASDLGTHTFLSVGVWITGHKLEESGLAGVLVVVIVVICAIRGHRKVKRRRVMLRAKRKPVWITARY